MKGRLAIRKNVQFIPNGQLGHLARLHAGEEARKGPEFAFYRFEQYFLEVVQPMITMNSNQEIQVCNVMANQRKQGWCFK